MKNYTYGWKLKEMGYIEVDEADEETNNNIE